MTTARRTRATLERAAATRLSSRLLAERLRDTVNIVYYHAVGPPRPYLEGIVTERPLDDFDRDLRFLRRSFQIVPLADALEWNRRGARRTGRPLISIAFDDGLDLIGTGAADVLESHRVSATTFVVVRCVDSRALMWRNAVAAALALTPDDGVVEAYNRTVEGRRLPAVHRRDDVLPVSNLWPPDLKDELAARFWDSCGLGPVANFLLEHRPYFSSDGLREWLRRGHSIGLHTATHPHCDRLSHDRIDDEVVRPASELRSAFGLESVPLAYPFGVRLPPAIAQQLVGDDVISCALASGGFSPRRTPPHLLKRCEVDRGVALPLVGRALGRRPLVAPPTRSAWGS